MGLFGLGKKRVVDLTENYKQQERAKKIMENSAKSKQTPSKYENSISSDALDFFANKMSTNEVSNDDSSDYSDDSGEDKKKKLAKRLMDMTDKIEDLSNQIYHLQQRIEVLEQKLRVGLKN
ncbi:MAG: hypothetical protein WC584_00625 [Candidatus Pacearchaeota archaeon]